MRCVSFSLPDNCSGYPWGQVVFSVTCDRKCQPIPKHVALFYWTSRASRERLSLLICGIFPCVDSYLPETQIQKNSFFFFFFSFHQHNRVMCVFFLAWKKYVMEAWGWWLALQCAYFFSLLCCAPLKPEELQSNYLSILPNYGNHHIFTVEGLIWRRGHVWLLQGDHLKDSRHFITQKCYVPCCL